MAASTVPSHTRGLWSRPAAYSGLLDMGPATGSDGELWPGEYTEKQLDVFHRHTLDMHIRSGVGAGI